MTKASQKKVSIVTTLYRSSLYIEEFYRRVCLVAEKITKDFEIIFVDDGSPDDSLKKAVEISRKDNRVKVIELSKNFGHHKAIMTGLSHTLGDYVFLIDSDLEEEPELLENFWIALQDDEELDVIYGIQENRKGSHFEKWSGDVFYKTFNYFSGVEIPHNFLTVRLMKKSYVRSLVSFQEKEIVFSILTVLTGYKTKACKVVKHAHSPTTYSFFSKINLLFNTVVASSAKPLWLAFNLGLGIVVSSSLYIVYLIYKKLILDVGIDGWTSVMVSITFFGGLIIFFLGVIGIYLAKVFTEVKNRPMTIVRRIYNGDD